MKATLLESREIAPEVRHFVFEVPDREFTFQPGQFVSFEAPVGEQEITRAYSIASPPNGNRFELCLNRVEGGLFSPWLFDMRPGDAVEVTGPHGGFVFREPPGDSLLVATGTGIAPFRAMLRQRLLSDASNQYTLIFGVRYEHGILYRAEFEDLARRHPNFTFLPTVSRPDHSWTGLTGRVQQHVTEAVGSRRDLTVYICGLKSMVEEVRALLKSRGFERKRIVCEKYD